MTSSRVGSASAASVRSTLFCTGPLFAHALHEPPHVPFESVGPVGAIGPVVVAVVAGLELAGDPGSRGLGAIVVGVDVVDEDSEPLRGLALDRFGAGVKLLPFFFRWVAWSGRAHHDEPIAELELALLAHSSIPSDLHYNVVTQQNHETIACR